MHKTMFSRSLVRKKEVKKGFECFDCIGAPLESRIREDGVTWEKITFMEVESVFVFSVSSAESRTHDLVSYQIDKT